MKKNSNHLSRVDIQSAILTATIVLISALCISYGCYVITYNDMIRSLGDRVNSIHNFIEKNMDMSTFSSINNPQDMSKDEYRKAKGMLESVKNISGVMYLYTAKENSAGELIYVIDGLDMKEDFRYPGDLIEKEIEGDLRRALAGEAVTPKGIKITEWGKIFITYLPVHKGDEVVGAVGIEFEAEHQFDTYKMLKTLTPIISTLFCVASTLISIFAFRRISNPNYKDMFNTDRSTGLKNRNSFDVDLLNLSVRSEMENVAIIAVDLNDLKKVNDNMGHSAGDKYIRIVARILSSNVKNNMIVYRTGGDEFNILVLNSNQDDIEQFTDTIKNQVTREDYEHKMNMSIAAGYAVFDKYLDNDLSNTYDRADKNMYLNKLKEKKEKATL